MNLQTFAEQYRLRVRKDSCGDEVIPGRRADKAGPDRVEAHHHVYEEAGKFFAYLNFPTTGRWNNARRRLVTAGLAPVVDTDLDGILAFNPDDGSQVQTLLKLIGVRVRRQLTPEQREQLRARLAKKECHSSNE
jgi:hypothetical protein